MLASAQSMRTSPAPPVLKALPEVRQQLGRAPSVRQVLELASSAGDAVHDGTDLQAMVREVAKQALALCGAEQVVVEVADADGVMHHARAGSWPTARPWGGGAGPDQPWRVPLGSVAQVCGDTEVDERVDREACRRRGARSLITVPLRHGCVRLGAITLTSSQPHAFDEARREAGRLVAELVRAAAVRVRVIGELREICRQCETALVASEARFRRLFLESPQPMWVVDAETLRFLAVNDAAVAKYGYSAEEFAGFSITALRRDGAHLDVDFQRARLRKTPYKAHHRLRDGRLIDVEVTAVAQEYDGRPAVISIVNDVTERNRLERQVRDGAFQGPLAGGANRALLIERIGHALARMCRRDATIAVLAIDLDGFTDVNNSIGHVAGDTLLQAAAERIRAALRPGDTWARLGADGFVVLLEDIDQPVDALRAAERLGEAFRSPLEFAGGSWVIGLSIGVTTSSAAEADADEVLRDAALAMHAAKAGGRNRVEVFTPALRATAAERLSLEQDLRHAVEHGELRVLFQPIVSVDSGAIVGCEALVRWHHPIRGLVSPDSFIPIAEETGVISAIDTWVLHAACSQAAAWRAAGLPDILLAVNASGRDLGRAEFVDRVSAALLATGFPRNRLEVEITESSAVVQTAEAIDELRRLRAAGISVAIDDFGTGYSSLSKVATFPVDRLKIDRSFVTAITDENDDAPLVAAMIALAHRLGLAVTAEGVETPEQLAFLVRNGCDVFQGYLVSPPVPADRFEELIRGQQASGGGDETREPPGGRSAQNRARSEARRLRPA